MILDKTTALALQVQAFSETSQLVTWLTADGATLMTLVKGACRPESPFLGQFDLFYTCELVLYRKDQHGLHIAREIYPLALRTRFRTDWRAFACASYACGLVQELTWMGESHPEIFGHVERTLDFLAGHGGSAECLLWFEMQMNGIMGWAPQLSRCAACGAAGPALAAPRLSISHGGILCAPCSETQQGQTEAVPADALAILRRWQTADSPRVAHAVRCTGKQLLVCRNILGRFLGFHLDLMPEGRGIALQMASAGTPGGE